MILKSVQVRSFKSVTDSDAFEVDKHVTCLVGKNESGKTAILEALYRLNPLPGHIQDFNALRDYPRRTLKAVAESKIEATIPIELNFEVNEDDLAQLDEDFGEGVVIAGSLGAKKNYKNELTWGAWPYVEAKHVERLVAEAGVDTTLCAGATTVAELLVKLKGITDPPPAVTAFIAKLGAEKHSTKVWAGLQQRVPKFLYFDEYSVMPGRVSIPKLQFNAVRSPASCAGRWTGSRGIHSIRASCCKRKPTASWNESSPATA